MAEISEVKEFWNKNPCGSYLSKNENRSGYFSEIKSGRYKLEWHIPIAAKFNEFVNKKVLEIGCGVGIDGGEFAKNSAIYYGIDLTDNAINLTKEYFNLQNLDGYFEVVNAENLPFANNEFDHIYSWGVIHHSPDTERIVKEVYRILKPGGTFCIMVYNRSSINYYLEIMFLRKLFRFFLKSRILTNFFMKLGFDKDKIIRHRNIYLQNKHMTKGQWISINTDGPDCPLAKVYNKKEAFELFKDFNELKTEVWFFNKYHWGPLAKIMPDGLCRFLGKRWGWHRVVYGIKFIE